MYRLANVDNSLVVVRQLALGIAIFALPELSYALGDPGIVYWFAGALLLDILCLAAMVLRRSKQRPYAIAIFLALSMLLWFVILTDRDLSVTASGAILTVFPVLYYGVYLAASTPR